MAYTQGDVILDDEYNIFVTGDGTGNGNHSVANVNTLWGVGSGARGFGQTDTIDSVTIGDTVSATQWTSLMNRVDTTAAHQGRSALSWTSPAPNVSTGDPIAMVDTLQANITTIFDISTANMITGTFSSSSANGSLPWSNTSTHTFTVAFDTVDKARYFFNSGGSVSFKFVQSGGVINAKNTEWRDMCSDAETITMDHITTTKTSAVGTVATGVGFYDLVTGNTELFRLYSDTSAYASNYILVQGKTNGTAGSNGGNGSILTFTVTFVDSASDAWLPLQQADGTYTAKLLMNSPTLTYLDNTWGIPAVGNTVVQN